jgi:hypothetical protein
MKHIAMGDFGKEHWSLLGYVETLCVDSINNGVGTIDYTRMRVNEKTHAPLARNFALNRTKWKSEYGTRLRGFWNKDESTNDDRRIDKHDDVDCLDDLEAEGLIEVISLVNGFIKLTDKGRKIAGMLRAHKSKGGYFSNFVCDLVMG